MDVIKVLTSMSQHVVATRKSAALATVIATSGSVPQVLGARIALLQDGTTIGTIGGGAIELEVLDRLAKTLSGELSHSCELHLTHDLGMCCGGQMSFFIERIAPTARLVFFGAGHTAEPSAKVGTAADFDVLIVDDREDWNTAERFPTAERLLLDGDEALRCEKLCLGEEDFVVICTHSHRLDEAILAQVARSRVAFIGLIGSQRKAIKIRERVLQRDPALDLSEVRCPVGLDLGAILPGEIAVAIVAELVQVRRKQAKPQDAAPR